MTDPNPKTVREIAEEAILEAARTASIADVLPGHPCLDNGDADYDDWFDAIAAQIAVPTVTVSWPDEQPQDGIDPYRGDIPSDDEFVDILSGSSSVAAEVTAFQRLVATVGVEQAYRKWRKLQQRARTEDEQPQGERDGDVRAVRALTSAASRMLGTWAEANDDVRRELWTTLHDRADDVFDRFRERYAALDARDANGGAGR